MAAATPVLLFAYANDRQDDRRYMRNLPEERRAIEAALRGIEEAGTVDVVQCPNATIEEVLDKCQRCGDRLAVFHFAGHADGKTLLFEQRDGRPAVSHARSIAEFLATFGGLKLVVLNGCSTQNQVDSLLALGIPAVVATSTLVRDDVATSFARHLYTALAAYETVETAFRRASSAVVVQYATGTDGALRALCRDVAEDATISLQSLWDIHGAGTRQFRLIAAADPIGAPQSGAGASEAGARQAAAVRVDAGSSKPPRIRTGSGLLVFLDIASIVVLVLLFVLTTRPPPSPDDQHRPANWVDLRGGSFVMGSAIGDPDEIPMHRVAIKSFSLWRTEVTVAEYHACITAAGCSPPADQPGCNFGRTDRGDHPMNCVTWKQASEFAAWVGGRLPSEAEWEYAARSRGREQTYPWGNSLPGCSRAVIAVGSDGDCHRSSTAPVGSAPGGASSDGIQDLAGNVWEWVADTYHVDYTGAPGDGQAWQSGEQRVARGGSWSDGAALIRAANRGEFDATQAYDFVGFRVAR